MPWELPSDDDFEIDLAQYRWEQFERPSMVSTLATASTHGSTGTRSGSRPPTVWGSTTRSRSTTGRSSAEAVREKFYGGE